MGQVDAHNGKGVPVEGGDLIFDTVKIILIKVLDLQFETGRSFISGMEGWDIFTGKRVDKFKGQNASWRVPKESMAWFPGPKWNEFVLKCKLNVPNSKKRKVVGQAKAGRLRCAYLAEGLSQLNAWTWLEQRGNVCNFWSCCFLSVGHNKSPENQPQKSLPNDLKSQPTISHPCIFSVKLKEDLKVFFCIPSKQRWLSMSQQPIGCPCSLTNISLSNNGGFMYGTA